MNADGTEVRFLDESDDTEHYFLRKVSTIEVKGLMKNREVPISPMIARAAHVYGQVKLDMVVDKSGKYQDINVTTGPDMLRGAAIEAARHSGFAPLKVGSRTVMYEVQFTYDFPEERNSEVRVSP